ncbi:MAG: transposase [Rhodobacteraceae bacterium]|nr:transposase [Paracoccaceae bacterium]MCY4138354.1 transposase [Paracoccaceae bacterium]
MGKFRSGKIHGPVEDDEFDFRGTCKALKEACTGRGNTEKYAVAGLRVRETNAISFRVVKHTDAPSFQDLIRGTWKQAPISTDSDEAKASKGMPEFDREVVDRSVAEYVRSIAHANGVRSFRSNMWRGFTVTCYHTNARRSQRFVNENSGRHNIREAGTIDRLQHLAAVTTGNRLTDRF